MTYNRDEKTRIIIDRYSNPRFATLEINDTSVKTNSSFCADNTTITIVDNKAKHISEGCAIFISSMDMLIEKINNNIDNFENVIKNLEQMINKHEYDKNIIGELLVFENVVNQTNRVNCLKTSIKASKKIYDFLK